jgi:hypothetical protein
MARFMRGLVVRRTFLLAPGAVAAVALAALAGQPLDAHHSVLGFDGSRSVAVTGTVHAVIWENPHARLVIDDESGHRWTVESESPRVLGRLGWTPRSLAAGDRVSTVGAPSRTGARVMRCDFVRPSSGARLPCYPARSL